MYCPSCSSPTAEGAKFCKSCGFSLTVVTQALSGGGPTSDPIREREYKRARRQISDGIQGSAIGAALLVVAVVSYLLLPKEGTYYAVSLALALAGVIKLFKSIGHIIDAKVGPKLLDSGLQTRSTGGLTASQPLPAAAVTTRVSQRLSADPIRPPAPTRDASRPPDKKVDKNEPELSPPGPVAGTTRVGAGRVNREHSSPLRKPDKEEDLMSKLRN